MQDEHARARQHPEGASGGRHLKINVSDSSLQRRPNITDIVVKSGEQEVKAAEMPQAKSIAAAGASPDQVAMLFKLREILDKAGPQSNDTAVVLGKLQEVLVEAKASQAKAEAHRHAIEAAARPPRSGVLDLVITHYNPDNAQQVNDFWVGFLKTPKVSVLMTYCFLPEVTNFIPQIVLASKHNMPSCPRLSHHPPWHLLSLFDTMVPNLMTTTVLTPFSLEPVLQ